MAKVMKVKRDSLTELGDGFEVLTDAEVSESGITVADDEVLVVAAPPPVQPPSGEGQSQGPDFGLLQSRLHTVNQESAARRIEIKDLKAKNTALEQQLTELRQKDADREAEVTKQKAKSLFTEVVKDKKLEFVSADAGEDVAAMVLAQVDLSKPFTKETVVPIVDDIIGKKKYMLKQVELPSTGGGKQSTPGVGDNDLGVDMAAIAQQFNIPYKEQKNGNSNS